MEQKKDLKDMVTEFATFLYQKGYRGKFGLSHNAGRIYTTGSLRNCLEIFLSDFEQGGRTDPHFELSTYADAAQKLDCTFRLQLDEGKGFLIREMNITDKVSRETKKYRLANNQQMHGSQSLQGMFPRPKPWDRFRKGKFRP
jgi:hypothetical protein